MEERRLPGETEAVWNLVRDGEVWTYRVWASPYLPEEVRAFPGCRQVVRMEREVRHKGTGEVRRTVSYALTSLGPEVAEARRLGELLLYRWEVENRSFWVRDVLLHEDACQVRGWGHRSWRPSGPFWSPCFTAKGSGRRRRPWRPSPSTPSPPCASWGSMRYSGQVWG